MRLQLRTRVLAILCALIITPVVLASLSHSAALFSAFIYRQSRFLNSLKWPWACRVSLPRVEVTLPDGSGTVSGLSYAQYGVETFLGIPFAQPPTGSLRFAAPKALPAASPNASAFDASQYGLACIQDPSDQTPRNAMSEDCLTVNVVRPAGLPANASLPVMVWIYGGSFLTGDTSSYNATAIVLQSMMRGQPIIYASFNYRLGAFGWMSSSDLANAAAAGTATLNPGLYDMQLGLQWVQNNIEGFGGDKDKVTIFGQSAGAIGIGSLLVADGGQAVSKLNLFRAAILQSGAPVGDETRLPNITDAVYSNILNGVGCSSNPTLDCLRSVSVDLLQTAASAAAATSVVVDAFNRVQDGYFHDTTPSEALRDGRVAFVPIIIGNVLDEGTIFTPTNIENVTGIEEYFTNRVPDQNITAFLPVLNQLLDLYPDNPTVGSPYVPVSVSPTYRFFGGTNQYKRMASIIGDMIFQSGRRALLNAYISENSSFPAWSYLFVANTPGGNPTSGVAHATDLPFVYGTIAEGNLTSAIATASLTMINQWVNFAWTLSPNADDLPKWSAYGKSKNMLQINTTESTLITDDYRADAMDFLDSTTWTDPLRM